MWLQNLTQSRAKAGATTLKNTGTWKLELIGLAYVNELVCGAINKRIRGGWHGEFLKSHISAPICAVRNGFADFNRDGIEHSRPNMLRIWDERIL